MKLVRLIDAAESKTPLGMFLGALMRKFELPKLLYNLSRSEMQSNYRKFGAWNYEVKRQFLSQLAKVDKICQTHGFNSEPRDLIRRINRNEKHILESLGYQVSTIRNEISRHMAKLRYLEIPQKDVDLFEPEAPLFGQLVHTNFKSSRYDIAEAGKCMALDRSTAAVMHLMRALEPALLAMAAKANYSPTRNVWGTIIDEIERRLNPNKPNYVGNQYVREYLARAATQFRHFKDAWRDHSMHAREKYTKDEAETVYRAVRAFMMHIAKRSKE